MYHYTYLLTFPNGKLYVGVHSTTIEPELDTRYLGSGGDLPIDRNCTKTILAIHPTREEAVNAETQYIIDNNCIKSEIYYNKRLGNYDKFGQTKETHSAVAIVAKKLKGRTKETHEYIARTAIKNSKYTGDNRTPAHKAADVGGRRTKNLGISNPAKGHPKTSNSAFVPWYFITPKGEYVEVHNETKKDYAIKLGFTERQMEHRFHYTNIDKKGKRAPFKDWVFGNL